MSVPGLVAEGAPPPRPRLDHAQTTSVGDMYGLARAMGRLAVVVAGVVVVLAVVVGGVPIPGGEHDPHLQEDAHVVQPPPGGSHPTPALFICARLPTLLLWVGRVT